MEKNLHDDNLENFFKKSLEGLPPAADKNGWDAPSDKVFDEILEHFAPVKPTPIRRIYPYRQWIAAAILVGVMTTAFALFYNRMNLRMQEQEQRIEALQQKVNNTSSIVQDEEKTILSGEVVEKEEYVENQSSDMKDVNFKSKENASAHDRSGTENNLLNSGEQIAEVSNGDEVNSTSERDISENIELGVVDQISTIAPAGLEYQISTTLPFIETTVMQNGKDKIKPRLYAGIYGVSNFNSRTLKENADHEPLHHQQFRDREQAAFSPEGGIEIGLSWNNKWKLSSGVSKYELRQRSVWEQTIAYDPSNETLNGEEVEMVFTLSTSSSYGTSELEASIIRDDDHPIDLGEPIPLLISTFQKIDYVSVPLMLTRSFGNGALKFDVSAGVAANFLNGKELEVQIMPRHEKFRPNRVRPIQTFKEVKDFSADYIVSAGMSIEALPHLSVKLAPRFRKNITSLTSDYESDTKGWSAGVQLGMAYRF